MATSLTPLVLGPDGVLRDSLRFSTTCSSRFFSGTLDATTVDVEVSIFGGAYVRDSRYVVFEGTSWTIPNPEVMPEGLPLEAGANEILIRAISMTGMVSTPAEIVVRLVQDGDVGIVALPPTNVSVEQLDGRVRITVDAPTDTTGFQGVSIYASQYEGGGVTGYTRVNLNLVDAAEEVEEIVEIGSVEVESAVLVTGDGTPAADPLYVTYTGQQTDADGAELQADFSERVEIPETTTRVRTSITTASVQVLTRYSFEHARTATRTSSPPTIYVGSFAATPASDPLFYVVTSTYFDATALVEVESSYSVEVVAHPLTVTTVSGSFPLVGRQEIVRNTVNAIFRSNPQLSVVPGSVLRDTFIEPFSSEAERIRFIVDFLHRAQSFGGLLGVDDPANTGESSPVSTNTYKLGLKQSFGLTKDTDVQAVVDRAFESLASNVGVFRRAGRFARGEVTFYTTRRPTSTILIPLGTTVSGGSAQFKVLSATSLPFERLARFYDPISGRYQVTVSVQATTVGASGNIGAGQVRKVVAGVTGLSVTNTGSMFGGYDQESNLELATRARNALASVDSGTARGYLQTVADVPGVIQADVVSAGDAIMERDVDALGVHRGGKVDVWVQGENIASVTDSFSFARDVAKDVHFVIVGDPADYIFRAVDSRLTAALPIVEMLDDESRGAGLRNATSGEYFDLTNVRITSFDTIQLSTEVVQPPVTLSDVVFGDYRRLTGNTFVFTRQPVRDVRSVTGTVSGELPEAAYRLMHPSDPLLDGRSRLAGDYLEITSVDDGAGGLTPSGESVTVTDEEHTLLGEYPEYLDNIGADPLTIVVTSLDGLTTYRGPDDPSGESDYTVVDGDETTPYAIQRVATGDISSGAQVLVSYDHDENFTVSYTTNVIVSVAQDAVDARRHVTADVLIKEGVPVPVDLACTVVLVRGSEQSTVDTALRTNLANLFAQLRLGSPVRQSDVVGRIEGTPGVSYVEIPFTKMVRQEGSMVVREALRTEQSGDATYLAGWSSPTISVWLIEEALSAATTDGGGPEEEFRGVFQDELALTLLLASPASTLRTGAGHAFIVGSEGIAVTGFSDDATLSEDGYASTDEIAARRVVLTANRILVSTSVDDAPTNHDYAVTYIVGVDEGAKNIETSKAEYLMLGDVEFTFDEDRG